MENTENELKIVDYDLYKFLSRFQEAVRKGYVLDDTVKNFPVFLAPNTWMVGLVKLENKLTEVLQVEESEEQTQEVVKRGRKKSEG